MSLVKCLSLLMLGRVILWMSLEMGNGKERVTIYPMLEDKPLHLARSYLLIHTSGISVQSAVPVDRKKLHFSYLAFLLRTLVMRCQEGKGSSPEVIY